MPYKIDFHTHSIASPDGSLVMDHYRHLLETGRLDYIAVTDHHTVDMALQLREKLGDRIIVGEEVTTLEGEVIGLYLKTTIRSGLDIAETIRQIRAQKGLVYIPHPFETMRKGIPLETLDSIAEEVDIIEVYNGRAVFQNYSGRAAVWAQKHHVSGAAGSDAHGVSGWGRTYTIISEVPTPENLASQLQRASYQYAFPGVHGLLYPKINRWNKRKNHA